MYKLVKLFDKAGVIPDGEKITRIFHREDGTISEVETDKSVYGVEKI